MKYCYCWLISRFFQFERQFLLALTLVCLFTGASQAQDLGIGNPFARSQRGDRLDYRLNTIAQTVTEAGGVTNSRGGAFSRCLTLLTQTRAEIDNTYSIDRVDGALNTPPDIIVSKQIVDPTVPYSAAELYNVLNFGSGREDREADLAQHVRQIKDNGAGDEVVTIRADRVLRFNTQWRSYKFTGSIPGRGDFAGESTIWIDPTLPLDGVVKISTRYVLFWQEDRRQNQVVVDMNLELIGHTERRGYARPIRQNRSRSQVDSIEEVFGTDDNATVYQQTNPSLQYNTRPNVSGQNNYNNIQTQPQGNVYSQPQMQPNSQYNQNSQLQNYSNYNNPGANNSGTEQPITVRPYDPNQGVPPANPSTRPIQSKTRSIDMVGSNGSMRLP